VRAARLWELAATTALLTACTGAEPVDGAFNNNPAYDAAYAAHAKAWTRDIGRSADIAKVRKAFYIRGGECGVAKGSSTLDCALDVPPRYPSLLTRRIMWSMTFAPEEKGRVRVQQTTLYHLGLHW
jgi:hypothetical protein